jgi:hypothetical protein
MPPKNRNKTQNSETIHFEAEPSITGGRFQDHLIICYGPPKIGKSTLFSLFPGAYFLATEPGYKALNVRKTDLTGRDGVSMWSKFRSVIESARKSPSQIEDVSMWVIDTVTNLSKACMDWTCNEAGVTHPSDQEWGKGWAAYADEFMEQILSLASLGKGIAFIAHQSTMEVVSRRMKVTKEAPDLPSTTYRIVNNMSDVILQMSYVKKGKVADELGELRCLYTKPSEVRDAGDRTGQLPDVIKFKTEKEAVRKILSCFNDSETEKQTVKHKKVKKTKKKKKKANRK